MIKIAPLVSGLALLAAACGPRGAAPGGPATGGYFAPADLPSSRYVVDARVDVELGAIEGKERIELRNSSRDALSVVAFDWAVGPKSSLEVSAGGTALYRSAEAVEATRGPVFVRLARALPPGGRADLDVSFRQEGTAGKADPDWTSSRWFPTLWWDDLAHHSAFSVKIEAPEGWAVAASGRLDARTGRYEAAAAKTFGLYLGRAMKTEVREVGGVRIASVFTDKGAKAAAICLDTAADAVAFYKGWLGFYPFPFLWIVPGGTGRWGGYPVATGMVAIHGLETYLDGEDPTHWRHITSHEIGHEDWGEWVLDPDAPAWVWIAMGIFADTEFMTVRGFDPLRRAEWMGNYIGAIPLYYDTTLDIVPDLEDRILYDRNNTVIHSKAPALVFALDDVLGRDVFLGIYKRCLRDYGGKRLGWRDLERICEAESGQSLAWFFDAWVRSNRYLCYAVESKASKPEGDGYRSETAVRRLGTMSMPIPVKAVFEDGSEQRARVDRTREVTRLVFASRAPLKEVVLDPEKRWAMAARPVTPISGRAVAKLAYGWDAAEALDVFSALKDEPVSSAAIWYRLGTELYQADRTAEALDAFVRAGAAEPDPLTGFAALAWRGLLEDLRGNRASALAQYRAALAADPGKPMNQSRQRIRIDKAWLEERLKTPFRRELTLALPERPAADDLVQALNRLSMTGEGRLPLLLFEKARGMEIKVQGFWFKLGLVLYDSGYEAPALEAFGRVPAAGPASIQAFASWVWMGHLDDLLGRREAALACYRKALELDTGASMQHGQYGMIIDRAWIEARLKAPFVRARR